jgi:hypothetical protein
MTELAELFDGSYPPSVLHPTPPPPVTPAGVVEGAPGAFTPSGAELPATLAALKADPVVGDAGTAKPTTPWVTGSYVVLGDASQAHWDGLAWVAGVAPVVTLPETTQARRPHRRRAAEDEG